ncbi:uncharacterized protein UTRI_03164_B [Ustilago trichophora]|uniref:RED-like N-terminal domain-containing protein n=1 Tax=Ustilago trichophora TaxID=86804 RepID=A0A5C3E877_9BASI|nr:uncharacterized protein UTRI_03164_B [Ustilago trichophora]
MDQDAFRALVSTSTPVSGPSSSSNSNRSFGKAHKRSNPASTSTKPSDLQPAARKPKSNSDYVDRAAARRSGKHNSEFRDVEALHADFEERIAAAETEEERQMLRDQISSVGGDAKYSVLVKGLDWALLAQNKAKISRENGDGDGADGEEGDLESAYQESKVGSSGDGGAEGNATAGKRSKEDIMEAIKRRREGKASNSSSAGPDQAAKSGFRPIGFRPIGGLAEEDTAEYKWVNGKRMRRKKKHVAPVEDIEARPTEQIQAAREQGDPSNGQASSKTATPTDEAKSRLEKEKSPLSPTKQGESASVAKPNPQPEKLSHPTSIVDEVKEARPAVVASPPRANPSPPAPAPAGDSEEEEEDIFADVGGWDGIPDTKDAEDEDGQEQEQQSSHVGEVPQSTAVPSFNEHSGTVGSLTSPSPTIIEAIESAQVDPSPPADSGPAPQPDPASEANSPPRRAKPSAALAAELSASTTTLPSQHAIEAYTSLGPAVQSDIPPKLSKMIEETSTPKSKSKKSKWDDDDDQDTKERKKKKKKKHH